MIALPEIASLEFESIFFHLPALPSSVRYWDDYLETFHVIVNPDLSDIWIFNDAGHKVAVSFEYLPINCRKILKLAAVEMLSSLDPTTVVMYLKSIQSIAIRCDADKLFEMILNTSIEQFREQWHLYIKPNCRNLEAVALKRAIQSLCIQNIANWHPRLRPYVSILPSPKLDTYKTVRTGDCFIPIDHQSILIDHFDDMVSVISNSPSLIKTDLLRDTCMLIISHQHALRNSQIAKMKNIDVRPHDSGAVHFSFSAVKQKRSKNIRLETRRIKREWCPIFLEYDLRRRNLTAPAAVPKDSYFLVKPSQVGSCIRSLVENLTGEDWSTSDLRHTAAQRQTDAGMSHLALAEFLTHASIRTGNVYFDTSPTQAQRVNHALALSPIYANVAEIARTRTINKAELLRLPEDKQIGGMPHGIPISGIGGCASGQSSCTKNPVLSCYICRKFMPVKDAAIHENVVESLRPVVLDFDKASRNNEENPAFLQLSRTLTAAKQVADDIKAGEDVTVSPEEMQSDE